MEKMGGAPSQEDQSKIQKERVLSDVDFIKGGAEFKEAGRLEVTSEQLEAAKNEMQAEKKSESPEVKSLEELKQKAQESGASKEDIKVLESKLEQARDGGEAFIAKKEAEYEEAAKQRQVLEGYETHNALDKKAEYRKLRDMAIGGIPVLAAVGMMLSGVTGVGIETVNSMTAGYAPHILGGLMVGGVAMIGAPIARIQNWLERRRHKKELSKSREEEDKKKKDFLRMKFGK